MHEKVIINIGIPRRKDSLSKGRAKWVCNLNFIVEVKHKVFSHCKFIEVIDEVEGLLLSSCP